LAYPSVWQAGARIGLSVIGGLSQRADDARSMRYDPAIEQGFFYRATNPAISSLRPLAFAKM